MKTGVVFGKFLPLHLGHIYLINKSATYCDRLYVVICENEDYDNEICSKNNIKNISGELRLKWLNYLFRDSNHIEIKLLNKKGLQLSPKGWDYFSQSLKELLNFEPDFIFSSEVSYSTELREYFPTTEHIIIDVARERHRFTTEQIRNNIYDYWDLLPGIVRSHFTKKVLITGTESCGKTTLVRSLAKLFNTSWVEEVGRYYAERYCGGVEESLTTYDYARISWLHKEEEFKAFMNANKICFIDTDAVVTQLFHELYIGGRNEVVESFANMQEYDLTLFLDNDVKWIDDGIRQFGEQEKRNEIKHKLMDMYKEKNMDFTTISGDFKERFERTLSAIDELLK